MVSCGSANHLADPCPHGRDLRKLACKGNAARLFDHTWCLYKLNLRYLTIGCELDSLFCSFFFC